MFANGGPIVLGPNQVRLGDTTWTFDTDKFEQDIKTGNLDGMNLYPILNAQGVKRGSEIQKILDQFARGDTPGIMPNNIIANMMDVPIEDRYGTMYAPGDFGSTLQNIGLVAQRGGQSARNVGAYLGNRVAQGYGIVADALRSPEMVGRFAGADKQAERQAEIDAGATFVPEEDPFSYTPLMTKDDIAKIRLNQMDYAIPSTISQDLENLDVVDTATVEEVPENTENVIEVLNPNTGTVEIRNLTEKEYQDMERDRIRKQMEDKDIGFSQNPEIQDLLDVIKPVELTVDVDKTEADSLLDTEEKFAGLSEEELKKEIEPDLISLEDLTTGDEDTSTESETGSRNPITRKLDEPGFFGSNRFLDFIRNVGGELVETGQMDEGLSRGAAKAAEERAARELMDDQEERDFASKLRLAKAEAALAGAGAIKYSEAKTAVEMEDEIGTAIKNFDEDERILSDINQILNEDINAPGAFGAQGFFGKINDKLRNAIGMGETEWENLPAEVRTAKILEITAQRSVRSILGESGKTISNLDRDIVARIFGDVNIWTSPAELKKILGNSRSQIIGNLRTGQTLIISRGKALNLTGYPSSTLDLNRSVIERILKFNFDQAETYRIGDSAAGYIETSL